MRQYGNSMISFNDGRIPNCYALSAIVDLSLNLITVIPLTLKSMITYKIKCYKSTYQYKYINLYK